MARIITEPETIELRWQLPKYVVDGLKAAHLVHGDGMTLMDYVANLLYRATPEAFQKVAK